MNECLALPSSDSALALVDGKEGALGKAILHTVGRTCLISIGMYAAGQRKNVIRSAVGASLAIEVFALIYFSSVRKQQGK